MFPRSIPPRARPPQAHQIGLTQTHRPCYVLSPPGAPTVLPAGRVTGVGCTVRAPNERTLPRAALVPDTTGRFACVVTARAYTAAGGGARTCPHAIRGSAGSASTATTATEGVRASFAVLDDGSPRSPYEKLACNGRESCGRLATGQYCGERSRTASSTTVVRRCCAAS